MLPVQRCAAAKPRAAVHVSAPRRCAGSLRLTTPRAAANPAQAADDGGYEGADECGGLLNPCFVGDDAEGGWDDPGASALADSNAAVVQQPAAAPATQPKAAAKRQPAQQQQQQQRSPPSASMAPRKPRLDSGSSSSSEALPSSLSPTGRWRPPPPTALDVGAREAGLDR